MSTQYIICTSQRSGSSFICECLKNSKVAGQPTEYLVFLERPQQNMQEAELALSRKSLSEIIEARGATQSGEVKGWKIMWSTMRALNKRLAVEQPGTSLFSFIMTSFSNPTFIYLERSNKIAQAISHVILVKSRIAHVWTDSQEQKLAARKQEMKITDAEIKSFVKRTLNDESAWRNFFEVNGVKPLNIIYEDFCNDLAGGIQNILSAVGIDADQTVIDDALKTTRMRKTRSTMELDLARNFLAHIVK